MFEVVKELEPFLDHVLRYILQYFESMSSATYSFQALVDSRYNHYVIFLDILDLLLISNRFFYLFYILIDLVFYIAFFLTI